MYRSILFLICINSVIFSQWQNVSPSVTSSDISCIRSIPGISSITSKIILCTRQGEIILSDDGCNSWQTVYRERNIRFAKIFFLNESTGWVLPHYGSSRGIFKSTDGGYTWTEYPRPGQDNQLYFDIYFINDTLGYLAKGLKFYKSTNGGITWTEVDDGASSHYGVYMLDEENILVAGSLNSIQSSTDDGISWSTIPLPDTSQFHQFCFTDSVTGYLIADNGAVVKTSDGGKDWFSNRMVDWWDYYLSDAAFRLDKGFYLAYDPSIYWPPKLLVNNEETMIIDSRSDSFFISSNWSNRTKDGGLSWDEINYPIGSAPRSCAFIDESTIIFGGTFGSMMKSVDIGDNLFTINNFNSHLFTYMPVFFDDDNGFMLTYKKITRTTDGGRTFSYIPYTFSGYQINCFTATDSNTLYIGTYNGKILKSTNRGSSWTVIPINVPDRRYIHEIEFVNKQTGYAATYTGIFKTTDSGDSWFQIFLNDTYRISFVDPLIGWWVSNGRVFATFDGGITYEEQGYFDSWDISFADKNIGIITSGGGIRYTTNGGNTFNLSVLNNSSEIYEIKIVKSDEKIYGFAGCEDGTLFYSADSGRTWNRESVYASGVVNEFAFAGKTIWAASYYRGFLMKKTLGDTVVPVELSSFTAELNKNNILLKWITSTETNNRGFEVERRTSGGEWTTRGFVEGNGTITEPKEYSFNEELSMSDKYSYRLKQIDYDGSFEYSDILDINFNLTPKEFALEQNYPNPFNPTTTIKYSVPRQSRITLIVYDALGKEITRLVDEEKPAGEYSVEFNAVNLSSGIYVCQMRGDGFSAGRKMLYLK